MYGTLRKNIGFSLLPWAFLFLFEPSYALFDPLPDFIGYFIICVAIINMADINIRVREAFCAFRKAIVISILKYASIYLLDRFFVEQEQTVSILLFVFIFSFCELVVLIPAYKKLFEGMLSLGMLYGGEAVYHTNKKGGANLTEKAFRFSVLFLIAQKSLAALPEFTTLTLNDSYEFIKLLRVFSIILAIPFGVAWLVKMTKYCQMVREDKPFIEAVSNLYTEKADANPNFFTVRVLSVGILMFTVGFALSLDVYSEHINLLPDFIGYAVIALAALFLRDFSDKWIRVIVTSALGIASSVTFQIFNKKLMDNFFLSEITKNIEAYNAYYTVFAIRIVEAILFVVVLGTVVSFMSDIFSGYTDLSRDDLQREHKMLEKTFVRISIFAFVTAIITAASTVFYGYAQPMYYLRWYYSYSLLISFVLNVVFVFAICHFFNVIKNCIRRRYSLYL